MIKIISCSKCSKEIKTKENLVVAPYFLIPKPYHRKCYVDILTKGIYPPLFSSPINVSWIRVVYGLVVVGALYLVWLFIVSSRGMLENPLILGFSVFIFLFVFVLTVAERLYSHFKFERRLE